MHGGSAPQVLAKARERLALAADDAVSVLIRLMADPKVSPSDRRQAAAAVLDRAGIRSGAELEVTVAPWIGALEGVIAEVPDDVTLTRTHNYEGRDGEPLLLPPQAGSPLDIVDAEVIQKPDDRPLPVAASVDGRPDHRPRSRVARVVRD
jgi:hypothetical protein